MLAAGDLQGELIIVQCELERGGFPRERGVALRKRELELLLAHEDEWAKLTGLARNWTFRRGFVDEITVDVNRFIANEAEIWRRAPRLRWVRFTGLARESASSHWLEALEAWDDARPLLQRALASGRVRYFSAPDAGVSWIWRPTLGRGAGTSVPRTSAFVDRLVEWLAETPEVLSGLRGLGLDQASGSTLATLAGTHASAGIEELEIEGELYFSSTSSLRKYVTTLLQPRHARLVNTRQHARPGELDIAVEELLRTPLAARLTSLESDRLMPVLTSDCAANLRSLRVNGIFDGDAIRALGDSERLDRLEHLAIDGDYAAHFPLDLEALHEPKRLPALRTLRLGSGVLPSHAARLLRSPLARRLEQIDLRYSRDALADHGDGLRRLWDGHLLV